jgi:hypothetical protein
MRAWLNDGMLECWSLGRNEGYYLIYVWNDRTRGFAKGRRINFENLIALERTWSRSKPSAPSCCHCFGLCFWMSWPRSCFDHLGNVDLKSGSFCTSGHTSSVGVPRILREREAKKGILAPRSSLPVRMETTRWV